MLRFIFRKNKSNKERLWSSPKDAPVLASHKPLLADEEGKSSPPSSPSTSRQDPTYSTISETPGADVTPETVTACHQLPCSTFLSPGAAAETGVATSNGGGEGKRNSIVFVESDAAAAAVVTSALDPDPCAIYSTVVKPGRPRGDQAAQTRNLPPPPHGPASVSPTPRAHQLVEEEARTMSVTPPSAPEAGSSDTDRQLVSEFDFTISLMEELLADFKTFEEPPLLPQLDDDTTTEPTPAKSQQTEVVADDRRIEEILAREPSPEVVVPDEADDILSQPGTCGVSDNIEISLSAAAAQLRKTVTFNDDVEKFERPLSLVTESDGAPDDTLVKVPIMEPDIYETPAVKPDEKPSTSGNAGDYSVSYTQNGCVVSRVRSPLPPDTTSLDLSVASDDDVYSDEEKEANKKPIIIRKFRGLRITMLIFAWALMGLGCELSDPALRYYSRGLNRTYEEVSRAYAAEGGGIALGAMVTGVMASYTSGYPDVTLVGAMMTGALSIMSRPWARDLLYFCLNLAGMGVARGMLLVGGTIYGYKIQDESKCTVLLYMLFTFYNLGALSTCQLFFILTNVRVPEKIHTFMRIIHYPPPQWGNATASEDHRATPIFPWSPSGFLLSLIVSSLFVILGLAFLSLLCYSASKRRRLRRREAVLLRKQRDRFKREIKMLGPVDSPELPHPEKGSSGRSPLLGRHDDDDSSSETDFGFVKPPSAVIEVKITNGKQTNGTVGNGTVTHSVTDKTPNGILSKKSQNGGTNGGQIVSHDETKRRKRRRKAKMVSFKVKPKKEVVRWFVGDQRLDVPLLMYLYVFFTLAAGCEMVMGRYLYEVILTAEMRIGQKEATCIMIAYWGASAVSRMSSLPVSRGLTPNVIMITSLTLGILSPVILGLYGNRIHIILWLFSALTGFAYGPLLSGGLTFANIYLNMVPKTIALAFAMAGVGAALFGWLGGLILDYFGCAALMYFSTGLGCLMAVLYIPVLLSLATRRLFKTKQPQSEEKVVTRKPAVTYL